MDFVSILGVVETGSKFGRPVGCAASKRPIKPRAQRPRYEVARHCRADDCLEPICASGQYLTLHVPGTEPSASHLGNTEVKLLALGLREVGGLGPPLHLARGAGEGMPALNCSASINGYQLAVRMPVVTPCGRSSRAGQRRIKESLGRPNVEAAGTTVGGDGVCQEQSYLASALWKPVKNEAEYPGRSRDHRQGQEAETRGR